MNHREQHIPLGEIHGCIGNMGGGKTTVMIGWAENPALGGDVLFLQHILTCRSDKDRVVGRTKACYEGAVAVGSVGELIAAILQSSARNVFIDEAQFFCQNGAEEDTMVEMVMQLREAGRNIYWSGLQIDFLGQPFRITERLMGLSVNELEQRIPSCAVRGCGRPAPFPQRLEFGQPVPRSHPRYVPDTGDVTGITYEARCAHHFERPSTWNATSVTIHAAIEAAGHIEVLSPSAILPANTTGAQVFLETPDLPSR